MIEVLKETTGVVGGFEYQPHIYYVNKKTDRLVAYCQAPEYQQVKIFETPMRFSKRYRKFQKIKEISSLNEV